MAVESSGLGIRLKHRRPLLDRLAGVWVVIAVGLGLIGYSAFGLLERYQATHNPRPLADGSTVLSSSAARPDETPVSSDSEYVVAADQPRSIELPTIDARGFIQKVSLDQYNAVAVPANITVAGWYMLGPRPGDQGVSIIAGHVQGRYRPGIFKHLGELKPGDTYSVELGDGTKRTFQVVASRSYSVAEVNREMFRPAPEIEQQLNLITCDGGFNKDSGQYEKRLLVVSKRLE